MDNNIVSLSADNFFSEVICSDILAFVDIWAEWCGPCKAIAPIIDALAAKYNGSVMFGKLNIDDDMDFFQHSFPDLQSIPAVILFWHGEPICSLIGACSEAEYEEAILDSLARSSSELAGEAWPIACCAEQEASQEAAPEESGPDN
ncbi:MAG: thioredoxin domain-containing protein [Eubacteriaceae bacterium]|nr:thioredoxin domain-containing protein [Eubacteriaceae bacterium]